MVFYLRIKDTAELFFEDVRLPESALLGNLNGGFYTLMTELSQERLLNAIIGAAYAEAMFEETRSYVKQRKAFGKQLSSLQVPLNLDNLFIDELCLYSTAELRLFLIELKIRPT